MDDFPLVFGNWSISKKKPTNSNKNERKAQSQKDSFNRKKLLSVLKGME